jgi:hypothetical protein
MGPDSFGVLTAGGKRMLTVSAAGRRAGLID